MKAIAEWARWRWIVIREGSRWVLRGQNFRKLEHDINRMSMPFAGQVLNEKRAQKQKKKIRRALAWLPHHKSSPYHDMMDRYGHSVREE